MTTRFRKLFSKSTDSRKAVPTETPHHNIENDDEIKGASPGAGSHRLHRSRSGRIKEISKLRMAIAQDTFVAPENMSQSAPVMSMRKMDIGLKGRELTMQESARLSCSLPFNVNAPAPIDSPKAGTNTAERDLSDSVYEFSFDENEVF